MLKNYQKLIIAPADDHIAGRLLTALVKGWDFVPAAAQGRLLSDACLIENGVPASVSMPAEILAFLNMHKDVSVAPAALR